MGDRVQIKEATMVDVVDTLIVVPSMERDMV